MMSELGNGISKKVIISVSQSSGLLVFPSTDDGIIIILRNEKNNPEDCDTKKG